MLLITMLTTCRPRLGWGEGSCMLLIYMQTRGSGGGRSCIECGVWLCILLITMQIGAEYSLKVKTKPVSSPVPPAPSHGFTWLGPCAPY